MKIKVQYNSENSLVCGYFPENKNYSLVAVIDEQNQAIDGLPYIEIEEADQVVNKTMCVVNGVYQEYVKPLNLQIEKAKEAKIKEIKAKRDILLNQSYSLEINGETLEFNLHYSNLPILERKLKRLNNDVDTDTFTTIDHREIHLNRVFFENYIREIEDNDRIAFGLAAAKIRELTALTTLIAVENFNTNLI